MSSSQITIASLHRAILHIKLRNEFGTLEIMKDVTIHQVKTNLSELLTRVELGEEIIISDQGTPIAKLVPFRATKNRRASLGIDRGKYVIPDDFNDPLPDNILSAFEGD